MLTRPCSTHTTKVAFFHMRFGRHIQYDLLRLQSLDRLTKIHGRSGVCIVSQDVLGSDRINGLP